jgi:hypothetical protein
MSICVLPEALDGESQSSTVPVLSDDKNVICSSSSRVVPVSTVSELPSQLQRDTPVMPPSWLTGAPFDEIECKSWLVGSFPHIAWKVHP